MYLYDLYILFIYLLLYFLVYTFQTSQLPMHPLFACVCSRVPVLMHCLQIILYYRYALTISKTYGKSEKSALSTAISTG